MTDQARRLQRLVAPLDMLSSGFQPGAGAAPPRAMAIPGQLALVPRLLAMMASITERVSGSLDVTRDRQLCLPPPAAGPCGTVAPPD